MVRLISLTLVSILISGCDTPLQLYWDYQVKRLCEKDGGVIVYNKITLTKEERNLLSIKPAKEFVTEKDDFYFIYEPREIINNSPRVTRSVSSMYRATDNKLIATKVYYSRVGGDIPTGIGHHSSYSCNQAGINTSIIDNAIIIKN